jgi:2-(1,2-epoxy-1,2-dihydrophenyl)acetyl-CoA isomerase
MARIWQVSRRRVNVATSMTQPRTTPRGPVIVEVRGSVMKITLNRPEVLNSFNTEMARMVRDALDAARADASVRAILLTGAGRAFCAGQDLSEVNAPDAKDLGEVVRTSYNPIIRAIRKIEKPVVCAVNGVAAGAGANLALACDIVVASEIASFIQSFSKVGLIPDSGGTFFLPRIVGLPLATAWTMLGDKIPAQRALELGMIYRVVHDDLLLKDATALARLLSEMPTRGLGLTKRGLNASLNNDLDKQLDLEEQLQHEAGKTDDYREGVAAFLEKRKPEFLGE